MKMNRTTLKNINNYISQAVKVSDKKWTFSKILCIGILIVTALIVLYSCVAMWYYGDFTPLEYLIPSVFAECAVVSGFYSWKAKEENQIKLDIQRNLILRVVEEQSTSSDDDDDPSEGGY